MLEEKTVDPVTIPGAGYRLSELARLNPLPRALAFDPKAMAAYYVIGREGVKAGEFRYDNGATVEEWFDCAPDETVYQVVAIEDCRSKPETLQDFDDCARAVKSGRLLDRHMPSSRLAPIPQKVYDAIKSGELTDQLREVERR